MSELLEWILRKHASSMWIELICLNMATLGGLMRKPNKINRVNSGSAGHLSACQARIRSMDLCSCREVCMNISSPKKDKVNVEFSKLHNMYSREQCGM
jgi:hypothetical protein